MIHDKVLVSEFVIESYSTYSLRDIEEFILCNCESTSFRKARKMSIKFISPLDKQDFLAEATEKSSGWINPDKDCKLWFAPNGTTITIL